MDIKIDYYKEGAAKAKGLCVIIDVFRACTVLCFAANKLPSEIIVSCDISQIKQLKNINENIILIGKNHHTNEIIFNTNNSPSEIDRMDLNGKIVIHHSEGGISGLIACNQADEVITGSFVNAKAVAKYIKCKSVDLVTLVCMGYLGNSPAEEDELCAQYIKALISDIELDTTEITETLKDKAGGYFLKNAKGLPQEDFLYCLDYNRFDFVLQLDKCNNKRALIKLDI